MSQPIGTLLLFFGLTAPPHWEEVAKTSMIYQACLKMIQTSRSSFLGRQEPHCLIKVDDD